MMDEGYIKFKTVWEDKQSLTERLISPLNKYRSILYDYHFIGAYPDGIGFGNLSQRTIDNQFIISGSKTGNFKNLGAEHYALVHDFDIDQNTVYCKGGTTASSESMTHAIIYQTLPEVQAVFHIHNLELWEKSLFKIPTTAENITYGTPEMAYAIKEILLEHPQACVVAMAGHEEGLMIYGNTLETALSHLQSFSQQFEYSGNT